MADEPILPFQLNVRLAPIFQFAAALADDDEDGDEDDDGDEGGFDVKALAAVLATAPGKDHVRVKYMPQPGGGTIRLSAEEGVLLLLGAALKNVMGSGVIPGFGQ